MTDFIPVYKLNPANIAVAADIATGTSVDKLCTAKAVADAAVAGGWGTGGGGGGDFSSNTATSVVGEAVVLADTSGKLGKRFTGTGPVKASSGVLSTANINLASEVTGALLVANGGSGQTSYTDGQLLIGNSTGNTLAKATITAGSGISVTNGNGSITIAATGGGGGGQWTSVFKTADESKTSNSTFTDDPFMTFSVAANTKYSFRGKLFFNTASSSPGFKAQLTGPASPTKVRVKRTGIVAGGTALSAIQVDSAFSTSIALAAGTGDGYLEFDGFLQNGANAGSVTIQWAQNFSNANATVLYAGSYIEYALAA